MDSRPSPFPTRPWLAAALATGLFLPVALPSDRADHVDVAPSPAVNPASTADPEPPSRIPPDRLTLEHCWNLALERNRDIQIERINPALARLSVLAAVGAYDPLIVADNRWEELADSGGLDPVDFSRDAIYQARSESSRLGVTGLAPSGLTYALTADYAHSDGVRNLFGFDAYSVRLMATVRQPLLRNAWIDSARYNLRVARLGVRTSEHALRFRIVEVMGQVAFAFHELGFSREQRRIRAELRDIRRSLLDNVRRQIQGGTLSALEENQAAAQLAVAEVDLATADQTATLAAHTLRTLIGDGWTRTDPGIPELVDALAPRPVVLDLETSWRDADTERADLALLRVTRDQSQIDVRYRRNQLFPSLDVVAGYGRRGSSTAQIVPPFSLDASLTDTWTEVRAGDNPNQTVGFVFSMPLTRRVERSRFRSAVESRNQTDLRIRQLEEWVRREVADAHALAANARDRVTLTRHARDLADAALVAEERKLRAGASALFFVLRLQGDQAAARIAERRAQADLLQALYRLQRADGTLLRANGYRFETDPPHPGFRSTREPGIARTESDR